MNCIIIDDEPDAIKAVKRCVDKTPGLLLDYFTTDPAEGLAYLQEHTVDLVFTDIHMEGMTGLELAKSVTAKVIITTAYAAHAVESYEYPNIIDYLLKPVEYDRFFKSILKAKTLLSPEGRAAAHLEVKTAKGMMLIPYEQIEYIEADRAVSLINGKDLLPLSIGELTALLPSPLFRRVHKSFIINSSKVAFLYYNEARLYSNKTIPIGRMYRP